MQAQLQLPFLTLVRKEICCYCTHANHCCKQYHCWQLLQSRPLLLIYLLCELIPVGKAMVSTGPGTATNGVAAADLFSYCCKEGSAGGPAAATATFKKWAGGGTDLHQLQHCVGVRHKRIAVHACTAV